MVLLPSLWLEPDALAGADGQEPDAISFILAEPGVLETREVNLAMPAVPAPAHAVEEKEGSVDENAPKKEETKELQEPREPENEIRKPDAVLEEAKPAPTERSKPEDNSVTGGAPARGNATTERKTSAPAAASAGSIRE